MTQTALTREQVLNAEPGTDLNVMVAEHVFGWRRILGSDNDYDGPVEYGEVLIPPNMSEAHAYAMMPPKGSISLSYFINRNWSQDISAAFEVQEKIKGLHGINPALRGKYVNRLLLICGSGFGYAHANAADRCKAALLAVLDL